VAPNTCNYMRRLNATPIEQLTGGHGNSGK